MGSREALLGLCVAVIRDAIDPECATTWDTAYRASLCAVNTARVIRGAAEDYPDSDHKYRQIIVQTFVPDPDPPAPDIDAKIVETKTAKSDEHAPEFFPKISGPPPKSDEEKARFVEITEQARNPQIQGVRGE